jgi:hypothetical protein
MHASCISGHIKKNNTYEQRFTEIDKRHNDNDDIQKEFRLRCTAWTDGGFYGFDGVGN